MCSGFAIAKVIAIYTGATGMAMLGQVQNIVSILNGIVNAPAGAGVIRYTAENINEGYVSCSPYWRASLQWIIGLLLIIVPCGIIFSESFSLWLFDSNKYYWLIIIACCALPLSAANTLMLSVINGQQKYKRYVSLGVISTLVSTSTMIVLIYHLNIEGALIAAAINSGVAGIIIIIISIRQPWFKLKYWWGITTLEQRKKIGGYVLMAITTALTVPVSLIIVRNILISQLGWDSAGQWQAVWKISEVYLSVITMSLSTYFLPRLSSLSSIVDIRVEINRTALIIIPIVTVIAVMVYLFRDIAINLLFTNDFKDARNLFAVQLCGDVIKIISWLYAYPMLSRGTTKLFIIMEVLFSSLFVLFSFIFVSKYGLQGVTVAYLVNYSLYLIVVYFNLKFLIK